MRLRFEDLEYWAEADSWSDAEDTDDPSPGRVLREAMHADFAGADDEAYEDALDAVLDGMSMAEAFSFEKALRQIQAGVGRVTGDPTVGQVARTALPAGAGALGTLIGGPAGTVIGSRLGTLAAGSLAPPGQPVRPPGAPPAVGATPAAAGGSAAAAQALVLTQQLPVLQALLQLSMGRHGAPDVHGIPVANVVNMLRSVVEQAAADADELAYVAGRSLDGDGEDAHGAYGCACGGEHGTGRALYTEFMDAENEDFAHGKWA